MTRSARERESRDNEASSTRESEIRDNEMVFEYNMDYLNPLDIPESVKREGYSNYWAATNIRGEPVHDVERLAAKGWTLVPASRAPTMQLDPLGRNPYSGKYIATKDLILMERPEHFLVQERNVFNHENNTQISQLRGVRNSFGEANTTFTNHQINSF